MDVYIWGERLAMLNAMIHLVTGICLLGAVTHHLWLVLRKQVENRAKPIRRFAFWGTLSYLVCFAWGCFIYPVFRYYVRAKLDQDHVAPWATGLFEIKEHWLAIGLAILPFYLVTSYALKELDKTGLRLHKLCVVVLNVIVWYSFIIGAIIVDLHGDLI